MPEALLLVLVLGRSPAASCKELAHSDVTVRVSALLATVAVVKLGVGVSSDEINERAGREVAGGKMPRVASAIMK